MWMYTHVLYTSIHAQKCIHVYIYIHIYLPINIFMADTGASWHAQGLRVLGFVVEGSGLPLHDETKLTHRHSHSHKYFEGPGDVLSLILSGML